MRKRIAKDDAGGVLLHIIDEFRTYSGDLKGTNLFPTPPCGHSFSTEEPIETCHPVCGLGLERPGNCLPVGRYTVTAVENNPRFARKIHLEREDGERLWCYYGNDQGEVMDWRGIKPISKAA